PVGMVGEGRARFGPLQQQGTAGCVGAVELDRAMTAVAAQGGGLEAVLVVGGRNLWKGIDAVGGCGRQPKGVSAPAVGSATWTELPACHEFTCGPRQLLKPVPPGVAEHVDHICPDVVRDHEMIVQLLFSS